ncbi:sulfurtransferase-like selenium metabolism protein YedF [Listeria sp. PSOL-1]|uniref:sulfurtransferase-like selenium metabolism protein YedF n=1 Tax=Listeria sp. PSOL-1 TaxID=1844999 RepID=UPI0013D0F4BC|nr:sulfurtransferase-like selenium metabolism protein YedF [Listeria sp. PSOL-1]
MIQVDAIGKPCPIPVIEAKKAIRKLENGTGIIEIFVDNDIAVQNIAKFARGNDYQVSIEQRKKDRWEVTITVHEPTVKAEKKQASLIVCATDRFGEGEEALGKILLKSYFYSLTELDTPPEHLIFLNRGAYLTSRDSEIIEDLKELAQKGTMISTCGTCLDFYQISDAVVIGEVTNMYGISEAMNEADKVITL